eukprot:6978408-Prymnesium_polylepis.1
MAAKGIVNASSSATLYDFSVDPHIDVGNVAFIGFTGASAYALLQPFFEEACTAVGKEATVR